MGSECSNAPSPRCRKPLLPTVLGKMFPEAQFLITGVVGPAANAHGPNEFLHVPYAKKLSACVSSVLADHAKVPGAPPQYRRRLGCILLKTAAIIEHCGRQAGWRGARATRRRSARGRTRASRRTAAERRGNGAVVVVVCGGDVEMCNDIAFGLVGMSWAFERTVPLVFCRKERSSR